MLVMFYLSEPADKSQVKGRFGRVSRKISFSVWNCSNSKSEYSAQNKTGATCEKYTFKLKILIFLKIGLVFFPQHSNKPIQEFLFFQSHLLVRKLGFSGLKSDF